MLNFYIKYNNFKKFNVNGIIEVVNLYNKKKIKYYCNYSLDGNLTRKELNIYKSTLVLTQEQKDILVGCLLGDLYIRIYSGKGMLYFDQKNKEYLFHIIDVFKPFIRRKPTERLQKRLHNSDYKINMKYKFNYSWYFYRIS